MVRNHEITKMGSPVSGAGISFVMRSVVVMVLNPVLRENMCQGRIYGYGNRIAGEEAKFSGCVDFKGRFII